MAAAADPYITAEFAAPVCVVESLSGPCHAEPILTNFILSTVTVVAFENDVTYLVYDIVGTYIGGGACGLAACHAF